jgi:tetratricopeptide (TPR) repeat protein
VAENQTLYERALRYGQASSQEERWGEAANAFKIAIRERPQAAEPYAGLGQALFNLKELEHALDCYKLASRYSNGHYDYLQRVADIQERLGQLNEASRTYMAAGEILLRQRRLDEAIANWQRAVRLEPGLLGAHQRLATVFQRQGNVKAAVREYLAIARSLQMRDEKKKALMMCQAALRLDSENEDVLLAMSLIERGAEALDTVEAPTLIPEEPAVIEPEPTVVDTVRQMATVLETEKEQWQLPHEAPQVTDPLQAARALAQEQLAEEIFRDEEDEELLYGSGNGLSKLERDALIGQGMDFQLRGRVRDAIGCYERAINGGLDLPAAHFTIGMLYADIKANNEARQALSRAQHAPDYRQPVQIALSRLN